MGLKELTVKEALQLLADKYPEPVEGWFCVEEKNIRSMPIKRTLISVVTNNEKPFQNEYNDRYNYFAIEVPDEYRYMTQQECVDWVCLHGYKGCQYRIKKGSWLHPSRLIYTDENICELEYRTIQEIGGKVVYGQPQEFKIKVA